MSATMASIVALESAKQASRVASDGIKPADRMPQAEQMLITLGHKSLEIRLVPRRGPGNVRHPRKHFSHAGHPSTADVDLAEENVGQDTDHGQRSNDCHPRNP